MAEKLWRKIAIITLYSFDVARPFFGAQYPRDVEGQNNRVYNAEYHDEETGKHESNKDFGISSYQDSGTLSSDIPVDRLPKLY